MIHRPLPLLLFGTVLLTAPPAAAARPPVVLMEHEWPSGQSWLAPYVGLRPFDLLPLPPGDPTALDTAAFDYLEIAQDVTWDPQSGALSATIDVAIRSQSSSAASFYALVDGGLTFTDAQAAGYTVTVSESDSPPFNYATVSLSPPVPDGEVVTVTLSYAGDLECLPYGPRETRYCGVGGALSYLMDGSAFPMIMDSAEPYGFDDHSRTLSLAVPSGPEVWVSADLQASDDDGTTLTTSWLAQSFGSAMYFIALAGQLDTVPVSGVSPTCAVGHLAGSPDHTADMASWMASILPFVDAQAGSSLPFDQLTVVKLPELDGFPGTATHSMVYLSETYALKGPEGFEETLAHENSHLWWGVLVRPYDRSQWLVEGPAVLSQYDYTAATHYPELDRDDYLASRYHYNALLLRYLTDPDGLPHLVLAASEPYPGTLNESVTWAYYKSSSTLDHLRVFIGDARFADGLRDYRAACALAPCTTDDFQAAMENAGGQDLSAFFNQWVYGTHYPEPTIAFSQPAAGEVTVTVSQPGSLALPLALRFELEGGGFETRAVTVTQPTEQLDFSLPGRVRAVRPNPRHDAIVWSRSAQAGDVDFTMEVDGLDLIRCALLDGRTVLTAPPAEASFKDVDTAFDPRCDLDDDRAIGQADLEVVVASFGAGVSATEGGQ